MGAGGREHALAERLLLSPGVREVVVSPGNAGTVADRVVDGVPKRLRRERGEPIDVARRVNADFVVVGPEVPLCAGLVDRLNEARILTYGPSERAALLEGSKAFMKRFCDRHEILTARYAVVSDPAQLSGALAQFAEAPVVKADGLCAGKGVVICDTHEEARLAALDMLSGKSFGKAGTTVVLEERLFGQEASVHAVCDGERFTLLPIVEDYKRIGDGDAGPNTGGMGTYAPANVLSVDQRECIENGIVRRIVDGMRAEGVVYRGTLFAGVMIPATGVPHLLEVNVRFGDPETQVLMQLLGGDFAALLESVARGRLDPAALQVLPGAAVCVVLAAEGYPGDPAKGDRISGLESALALPGVAVYHAGTRSSDEGLKLAASADRGAEREILTDGGRVLGVVGRGSSLIDARNLAYAACDLIDFRAKQLRRDIGRPKATSAVRSGET